MVVLVLERVPPSLRGELSRWLLELKAGVFIGHMTAGVRERLWNMVIGRLRTGAAYMVHPNRSEQGFAVLVHGDSRRVIVDYDGLLLVQQPAAPAEG